MIKRVLAFLIAFILTLLAMFAYYVAGSPLMPRRELVQLIITLSLFVGAIYVAKKLNVWSARLLLIGAVALVILRLFDFVIDWLIIHESPLVVGPTSFLFPTDTLNPAIVNVFFCVWLVSFAFLAGLFWLVFQVTHHQLTNRWSEPLTGAERKLKC